MDTQEGLFHKRNSLGKDVDLGRREGEWGYGGGTLEIRMEGGGCMGAAEAQWREVAACKGPEC